METILVTGASGLLGTTLVPQLKSSGHTVVTHARRGGGDVLADLAVKNSAFESLNRIQPKVIVNLVGLTSVEQCEEQPNAAYLANTRTVENLASWIRDTDSACHLVQISTDHVYDGMGSRTEEDVTLTNIYAFSKYAGELAAAKVPSTILRTNFVGRSKTVNRESLTDWVYNSLKSGKHIKVLEDVFFCPLSMGTLGEMIHLVIEEKPVGTFNLGSRNGMSKADFDFAFAVCLGLPTKTMTRISIERATFLKAYRPKYMQMDCAKFEQEMQIELPTLQEEMERLVSEYHD